MHGVTQGVRARPWRPLVDTVTVVGACVSVLVLVLVLASVLRVAESALGPLTTLLTMATAAAATGAAILAEITGRIRDEPRWSWAAAAFALYGVVVLPVGVLAPMDSPRLLLMRLTAYVTALALLVVSLRPPRRIGPVLPWGVTVGGAAAAMAALAVPDAVIAPAVLDRVFLLVVLPGWTAVAVGYVAEGRRRGNGPWLRLGLGMAAVAAAQLYRAAWGVSKADPPFVALRLAGAVVVLVALAQIVARSLADVASRQWALQEELAVASVHLERAGELAAERDHELRNGLAGLAGITHLLSRSADAADHLEHQRLERAVLSELGRLHTLLGDGGVGTGPGGDAGAPARTAYLIEPVLSGLVTLRRSAGVPAAMHAEPGLTACGDSAVLAQVLTNLFANCDRHAPGAPVTVRSYRDGADAVVEVRDEGPGLGAALGHDLLRRGVHDPDAGGRGLGLHISARLVHREGGALDLRTVTGPPGCLATVRLPVGGAGDRPEADRPDVAPAR